MGILFGGFMKNRFNKVNKTNTKIDLLDNVRGRSITEKVIPTVCNIKVMLNHLKENEWKIDSCRPWEKRSYKAYKIDYKKSKFD